MKRTLSSIGLIILFGAVAALAKVPPSDARTLHQRPALIQELTWRLPAYQADSILPVTDPVVAHSPEAAVRGLLAKRGLPAADLRLTSAGAFTDPAEAARGVRYNEPSFGISWPLPVDVISDADRNWPDYVIDPRIGSRNHAGIGQIDRSANAVEIDVIEFRCAQVPRYEPRIVPDGVHALIH